MSGDKWDRSYCNQLDLMLGRKDLQLLHCLEHQKSLGRRFLSHSIAVSHGHCICQSKLALAHDEELSGLLQSAFFVSYRWKCIQREFAMLAANHAAFIYSQSIM